MVSKENSSGGKMTRDNKVDVSLYRALCIERELYYLAMESFCQQGTICSHRHPVKY